MTPTRCAPSILPRALLIGLVSLLAACLGPPASEPLEVEAPDPPTAKFDRQTCGIEGLVFDDSVAPVPGTLVHLVAGRNQIPDQSVWTDAEGLFAFSYLPPGVYEVTALKVGYKAAVKQVHCTEGDTIVLRIQLDSVPDPGKAFRLQYGVQRGMIGCSVRAAWYYPVGPDPCSTVGPLRDLLGQGARNHIDYLPPQGNVTGLALEMVWRRDAAVYGGHLLTTNFRRPESDQLANRTEGYFVVGGLAWLTGKSPLELRLETQSDLGLPVYEINPDVAGMNNIKFSVSVALPTQQQFLADPLRYGATDLVLHLKFDLYLTLFYHGEPIPEPFLQRADG